MSGNSQPDSDRPTMRPHSFIRLDTLSVPAKERFDYWKCQFLSMVDRGRGRSEWANDFRGSRLSIAGHNGITFANVRADPMIGAFGNRDSGLFSLAVMHEGDFRYRQGNDETAILDARSGLFLTDCDRPAIASRTRCDYSTLMLPRSVVAAAMGGDPMPRGKGMRLLPNDGLSPILQAHLKAMAAHGEHLAPAESTAAMRAANDMALVLLSRLHPRGLADSEALDDALFTAARRYIKANLERHDLTAEIVAAGVGCSRASLYRVFARRNQTVGDCLRETRLQHASRLLETLPTEPIAMIAFDCGYTDLSAFGKAFKRQFGMTPGDWRIARAEGRLIA